MAQAALGAGIKVMTLDGEESVTVPSGVQHGHRMTLPNKGVPHIRGVGRGDFFVILDVIVPKKLSKEQKELLEKFAEITGEPVKHNSGGFFNRIFD